MVAEAKDICPKKSPLVQVEMEFLIEKSVIWASVEKLEKMATKLGTVKIGNYIDKNKDILKEMGVD